jgi:hypothetical protein
MAQAPPFRGPTFQGTVHIVSDFEGGGPTLELRNQAMFADVAIDFISAEDFMGNIGTSRGDGSAPSRLWIQHDATEFPLTLAEGGGNVGVGTSDPQSALQVVGYLQIGLTAPFTPPPAGDCDASIERGRMLLDSGAGVLWVCADLGWMPK